MPIVEVSCPHCRKSVHVRANEVRVWSTDHGAYLAFVCPECQDPAAKRMHPDHVAGLARIGAVLDPAAVGPTAPAALERSLQPDAPRFGWDDLVAFHELLDTDDWFERLLGAGS